ncbi:AMP-binding protein [Roseateles sp. BYS180W]|uniref:AMP-binding protein n=1 Tax=Roseateles rivi TaxID=3299028 RepID=A0ABW7FUH5_9BURK
MADQSTPLTLALQQLYRWEREAATDPVLHQPLEGAALRSYTWAQVADETRRMAAHLRALGREQGWESGARVAILSKNCAWWLMSDLAIWMAGYVSVPLYPTLAPETIRHILEHSDSRAIFVGKLDGWEAMQAGVPAGMSGISYPVSPASARQQYEDWDTICARTEPVLGEPLRGADELATLIYTSGTTGMPKGVMHSFGNFAWAVRAGLQRLPLHRHDRMLSYLPLAHVVERVLVEHCWLATGMQLYFAESLDTFTADLQRAQPTLFFSVPRLWTKFQQGVHAKLPPQRLQLLLRLPLVGWLVRRKILKALGLSKCRVAAGGAAPMPTALLQWFRQLGLPICEGYGMSENLAVSHITVPGQDQTGTVGIPYEGVETRVDPVSGELLMRSPALMLGYFKQPELSAEVLDAEGWLHTGDKAAVDERGCTRITGRVKDLFKTSKGKYVAPAPIEDRLGMHPAIEACAVVGANLAQPLGLLMLNPQAAAQRSDTTERAALEASLRAHLQAVNAHLDPHEQLGALVLLCTPWTVDNGLVTPTLKVRRPRVEELFGAQLEGWAEARQPLLWGD